MKKLFVVLFAASMIASCTKSGHGSDDVLLNSRHSSSEVEDNPNGGGGNNTRIVPANILSAFNTTYPDATRIQWKLLSNGNYKAEFFRGSVKWQVIYSPSGSVVKVEHT